MPSDEPNETASRILGSIVIIVIVFAALYPIAGAAHLAYRIVLAGWGS